ncbi:hypothetical protein PFISCL1PPCAC_19212, partial [Pristionchus fissidentatus]
YRKGWFENSIKFFFQFGSEPIIDSSTSYTLDSLCSFNGYGSPFFPVEAEKLNKLVERKKRLDTLEEEIAEYREKCAAILELKGRMSSMQEKVKKLSKRAENESEKVEIVNSSIQPMKKLSLLDLPKELISHIFSFLNIRD